MKTCKGCGKKFADEVEVCDACGAALESAGESPAEADPKEEKGFFAKLPFILNVAALAVMAVVLICGFFTGMVYTDGDLVERYGFFTMLKQTSMTMGLASIALLINIAVTLIMLIVGAINVFKKKKDAFRCFGASFATTVFATALSVPGLYSDGGWLYLSAAGVIAIVLAVVYYAAKTVLDTIVLKKKGESIALPLISRIATLLLSLSAIGTSFYIVDTGDTKLSPAGWFINIGWKDYFSMITADGGFALILTSLFVFVALLMFTIAVLVRELKGKPDGRRFLIPGMIFYIIGSTTLVMLGGSIEFAPTLFIEILIIIAALVMLCIENKKASKKDKKEQTPPAGQEKAPEETAEQ